jgi:hypothetical protein
MNGSIYTGEWLKNKMSGSGKYEYPDGSYFEGSFKDGNFFLKGKFVLGGEGGEIFDVGFNGGLFMKGVKMDNGKLNGDGLVLYENMNFNYGSFEENVQISGKKRDQDYFGSVIDSKRNGEGILVTKYGDRYDGWFQND